MTSRLHNIYNDFIEDNTLIISVCKNIAKQYDVILDDDIEIFVDYTHKETREDLQIYYIDDIYEVSIFKSGYREVFGYSEMKVDHFLRIYNLTKLLR